MKNNKIKKVVLYYIERNGKKVVESAIWKGENIQIKDKAAGIDALHKLAKEKGYKNVEDLKKNGYFIIVNEEQLKEKYPDLYSVVINKEDENIDNLDDSFLEKPEITELKIALIKSAIYLTAGIFTILGFSKIEKNNFGKNMNSKTTIESTEDIINFEDNTEREINVQNYETAEEILCKYNSVSELLASSNINSTKKEALSNIWNYISNYNISIAKNHSSSTSDKKLAHTWNEVMVDYLAYNDISLEEASKIFDYYNIPIDLFKEEYKAGFNQDVLAYTVLKTNTNKADLIISEEGKEFYQGYENLIIKYNKTVNNDPEDKEIPKLINNFYNKIRRDFDVSVSKDYVEDYKLSVIPIINAFDGMLVNYNYEGKLTKKEKAYFTKLSKFNKIENKISTLSDSLASINITENFSSEFADEYTYSQIRDVATSELTLYDAYKIDEVDRNISEYPEYKSVFITSTEQQQENTKNEINKTNNKNYSNYNDAGMAEDEEEKEIPDWMFDDNKPNDNKDIKEEEPTEEIHEVDSDTPAVNDEEYSSDYDESIKDVTPDETNSDNNSLPDPNKSPVSYNKIKDIIADKIIEMMCESTNKSQNAAKYTKKV